MLGIHVPYANRIGGNKKFQTRIKKIVKNSIFDCYLSNDFWSTFIIDSINIFDCRLSGVILKWGKNGQ